MKYDMGNILKTEAISGSTINSLPFSPEFNIICYTAIFITGIAAIYYSLNKAVALGHSVKRAAIITFLSVGFLCAAYADTGWTKWLGNDIERFKGLDTEEKILAVDDRLYRFAIALKEIIPERYYIFSSFLHKDYPNLRLQYLLLPLKKDNNADLIIVTADEHIEFNPETGVLTRETIFAPDYLGELILGSARMDNLELVMQFAKDGYLLKKK